MMDQGLVRIDNPLAHRNDLEELAEEARRFAARIDPDDPDEVLWEKAALLARDPLGFSTDSVEGLTATECRRIQEVSRKGFWSQPKTLQVSIVTLCLGAIIQGWSQTSINGANQSMPEHFGLRGENGEWIGEGEWIFAALNAAPFLSASVTGCWLSDPLQSWLVGRRGAVFVSGLVTLAAAIGGACTHTWQEFLATRIIMGLGTGAKASVVPIFGAEVAPPHLRGALVMNWQLFVAFGIFLGFTSNLICADIGPLSWRFQIASLFLPVICLLCLIWIIPESPRFLLRKGRVGDAYNSLVALRGEPLAAAQELYFANAQIQTQVRFLPKKLKDHEDQPHSSGTVSHRNGPDIDTEKQGLRRRAVSTWRGISRYVPQHDLDDFQRRWRATNFFTRLGQLFRDHRSRTALLAAFTVMMGQQLCGVNVLVGYSSTWFEDVNRNGYDSLWLSWGFGLANFLFTFPAYYFIDKHGRRWLLLASYPGMTLSLLAACLCFLISSDSARNVAVPFFIILFVIFYSWGQGPVSFAYSSEVFQIGNREIGMSFAVAVNLFGAGMLTLFVPKLTTALQGSGTTGDGQSRLLGIFVGLNILSFILIFLFVPETCKAVYAKHDMGSASETRAQLSYISLEEIDAIFEVPIRQQISYQFRHVVPWAWHSTMYWLKRYVLRKRLSEEQRPSALQEPYVWQKPVRQKNQVVVSVNQVDNSRTGRMSIGEADDGDSIDYAISES